jgi:hypothetical protein
VVHDFIAGSRETAYTFGKPSYFESMKKEHFACREEVACFDMSPFVKIEIEVNHGGQLIERAGMLLECVCAMHYCRGWFYMVNHACSSHCIEQELCK